MSDLGQETTILRQIRAAAGFRAGGALSERHLAVRGQPNRYVAVHPEIAALREELMARFPDGDWTDTAARLREAVRRLCPRRRCK